MEREILQSNERGINAMSISDITGIPKPTVMKNELIKMNVIEIDKKQASVRKI